MHAIPLVPADRCGSGIGGVGCGGDAVIGLRRRPDPAEREKRRRLDVNIAGRLADGSIIDVTESTVYYSYSVHGVGYTAAQDVSPFAS